jgi:hypothetical protein
MELKFIPGGVCAPKVLPLRESTAASKKSRKA